MSNLTIVDLDFCERELCSKREVKGGFRIKSSSVSSSYSPAVNTAPNGGYSYSSAGEPVVSNGNFGLLMAATAPSAVDGLRANALAVGDSTYTLASVSTF